METLRAIVVGLGKMGSLHSRVYAQMEGVRLVGVIDRDLDLAQEIADRYECLPYGIFGKALDHQKPDLVSICTPTRTHYDLGMMALGCSHVLIEKPLAATVDECSRLIRRAEIHGYVLAVGHIERFNPAIEAIRGILNSGRLGRVQYITARRRSPRPERVQDCGVGFDLAIHDLDLFRFLLQEDQRPQVLASVPVMGGGAIDQVDGMIYWKGSGAIGFIHADWVSQVRERSIFVVCEGGTISIDLMNRSVLVNENGESIEGEVHQFDPIRTEIAAFVDWVREERKSPSIADGLDGLEAVKLAEILERGQ